MLSPIKESRRENGSNQELRCSPERWSITSGSPTHSASGDINGPFGCSPKFLNTRNGNGHTSSLERYHVVYEENGKKFVALKKGPNNKMSRNFVVESLIDDSSISSSPTRKVLYSMDNHGAKKKGSSRIRYENIIHEHRKCMLSNYNDI